MRKIQYTALAGSILIAAVAGCGFGKLMYGSEVAASPAEEVNNTYSEALVNTASNAQESLNDLNEAGYDISKVAIVNLDEGIKQDTKKVYYAKQLLSISDNKTFSYESLEDAKTGSRTFQESNCKILN